MHECVRIIRVYSDVEVEVLFLWSEKRAAKTPYGFTVIFAAPKPLGLNRP